MKTLASFLVAIVVGTSFARADQDPSVNLTVISDPPGATVYANRNKKVFGPAPFVLKYTPSKDFAAGKKCQKLQPITAKWPNGVEASLKSIVICPKDGTNQQVTLHAPAAVPQQAVSSRPPAPIGPRGPKTLYVTYHSDPEGAMLYTNGTQAMGYTPVRLKYESPKGFRDGTDCAILQPTQVRWVSGATASIEGLRACSVNGGQQSFGFARPTGPKTDQFPNGEPAPGLEIDLQFAFQRELLARLDAQAQAQATRDAWAQAAASVPPPPVIRRPLSCSSIVIGQQIFTSCQ